MIILLQKQNESSSSEIKNSPDEKPRHKHGKPVNISYDFTLNSETYSDRKYCDTTDASAKNHVSKDEFTHFNHTTGLSLHKNHFHSNFIKFVLGSIPKFENITEK